MSGSGICPNCQRPIIDHDDAERKACHDAVSGYRREAASRESPGYVTTLPTGQRVEIGGVARESQTEGRADG